MTETATQAVHRATAHQLGYAGEPFDDPRTVRDAAILDVSRMPYHYKRYAQPLSSIALPRDLPATKAPALAVLAGTADISPAALDLPHLSRILHLSAGVVRTTQYDDIGVVLGRAAGSAGGRFPLELYVAIPEGTALPAGVHWYDPHEHALRQVAAPPPGGVPTLVVTGVPWRTGWRYRERGYRHLYWDAGTLLAQTLAAADSAGLDAQLYTTFPDHAVANLVGADQVHEFPLALVAFGDGPPALRGAGQAETGDVDAAPVEFPLITSAQQAGVRDHLGQPWVRGAPAEAPTGDDDSVETIILARGSTRRLDPTRGLPRQTLRACMALAMRGIDVPHHVVVHDVDGFPPGVYRWPDLSAPTRSGQLRDDICRACFGQTLPRDAAFVVVATTDLGTVDDRQYRDTQLAAGIVLGRVHLIAHALGAGASGMTFIDSELPELLGARTDGLVMTCVGIPDYRSKPGGLPGQATAVQPPPPRS